MGEGSASLVHPLPDGSEAVDQDRPGHVHRLGRREVRRQGPHGRRNRLQLGREGGKVRVRLVLDVLVALAVVDVHALEHGQEEEPPVEEVLVVVNEPHGDWAV